MCGIAGIVGIAESEERLELRLSRMLGALKHRGPDGEGVYKEAGMVLGHRRLAIIDPEKGQQPIGTEDGRYTLTYNGEVYNYLEIKRQLHANGVKFRTNADSEVLLELLALQGMDAISQCNGMWAFAIWDKKERQLALCRDRLGEKPLFYTMQGNQFLFASELKALFAAGVSREPDWSLLEIYLALGFVPSPYTFFKNIWKLNPGCWLFFKNGEYEERSYWETPQVEEAGMNTNDAEIEQRFAELFSDSVKLRMRSDVPIGAFLSGGLDSTSVVSALAEHAREPIRTFTVGFGESKYDERSKAQLVASSFHTRHTEKIVQPESLMSGLVDVASYYDEPFGDASALPTNQVCAIAAKDVKVVLTGDGGDEVLSGYSSYQGERFARDYSYLPETVRTKMPDVLERFSRRLKGPLRYKFNRAERILRTSNCDFNFRALEKAGRIPLETVRTLTSGNDHLEVEEWMADLMGKCAFKDPFYKLMYFHMKCILPNRMLTKVDRVSMANSIETRLPFLDNRLVEYMTRVDHRVKMRGYQSKSVLRKVMKNRLPRAVLKGGKRGFSVPLGKWFRDRSTDSIVDRLWKNDWGPDQKEMRRMIELHRKGEADYGDGIWALLVLREVVE